MRIINGLGKVVAEISDNAFEGLTGDIPFNQTQLDQIRTIVREELERIK